MFENEHTLRHFASEKAEGEFHVKYERALEQARLEFGKKYLMVINGKHVKASASAAHSSPIDNDVTF